MSCFRLLAVRGLIFLLTLFAIFYCWLQVSVISTSERIPERASVKQLKTQSFSRYRPLPKQVRLTESAVNHISDVKETQIELTTNLPKFTVRGAKERVNETLNVTEENTTKLVVKQENLSNDNTLSHTFSVNFSPYSAYNFKFGYFYHDYSSTVNKKTEIPRHKSCHGYFNRENISRLLNKLTSSQYACAIANTPLSHEYSLNMAYKIFTTGIQVEQISGHQQNLWSHSTYKAPIQNNSLQWGGHVELLV